MVLSSYWGCHLLEDNLCLSTFNKVLHRAQYSVKLRGRPINKLLTGQLERQHSMMVCAQTRDLAAWVWILAVSLTGFVVHGKLLNFLVSQLIFLLFNGDNNVYIIMLLLALNDFIYNRSYVPGPILWFNICLCYCCYFIVYLANIYWVPVTTKSLCRPPPEMVVAFPSPLFSWSIAAVTEPFSETQEVERQVRGMKSYLSLQVKMDRVSQAHRKNSTLDSRSFLE